MSQKERQKSAKALFSAQDRLSHGPLRTVTRPERTELDGGSMEVGARGPGNRWT
jgi:hypothetical protein